MDVPALANRAYGRKMNLALFDFDGTVTTHDSFRDFLLTTFGKTFFLQRTAIASPYLLGFILGLISRQNAKEKVCELFFKGMSRKDFNIAAEKFTGSILPLIIRPAALEKIRWHRENGDRIILVSASFEDYLAFWCRDNGMETIGTRLEEKDGALTGRFATPNCWGPEKVNRIKSYLKLEEYSTIYAYGDSRGDKEMLALANEPFYKPFRS